MPLPNRKLTTMERRFTVILAVPTVLPWAFISTLWRETKNAWWRAWIEVRIEAEQMYQAWTNPDWRPR